MKPGATEPKETEMGDVAVLRSGADYPIPTAALDERLGWLGTSGSGKTYNAGGGVERLLQSGARVVIVDPLGVWWGLRLLADGKNPSPLNVAIFGGPHGDLPLNEHSGALIGETAATMAESCIVDLSEFASKAADRRFMSAFLETIYRKAGGEPFHLIVDEADLFAPQKPGKGDEALLGHMENIVRRGRVKGFIPWLISQRPAVLNKNVLSQVDGLIAFMLTASHDRNALDAWIEGQADPGQGKQIKDALPTLPVGTGVVWLPRRQILATGAFPPKLTFDSSRTPKRGEKRERRDLKPLDLGRLQERLASVEAEVKANDPRTLKATITDLQKKLAAAERAKNIPGNIPAPAWPDQREEVSDLSGQLETALAERDHFKGGFEEYRRRIFAALSALGAKTMDELDDEEFVAGLKPARATPAPPPRRIAPAPAPVQRPPSPAREVRQSEGSDLPGPQQRILNSLAWWSAFGHGQPINEQVAFIAGYSPSSTGYTNPRGALKSAGLVHYPQPGRVALTEEGAARAASPDVAPTGEELRRRVMEKLSGPQQRILSVAIAAYPDALENGTAAQQAGYSHTSTGYTNPRGSLKTLDLIGYPSPGYVRAADWLFP